MVLQCKYCNRIYKKQINYTQHILFCEILNKTKQEKEQEEDILDTIPSQYELFQIVKILISKYDKLNKDNENLKQLISNRKKKLNVIDWLNLNCNPNITFLEWLNNIKIEEKELEYVFNLGNIDGIILILQEYCSTIENNNIPIKSFNQKENTIYIYEIENNKKGIWKIISKEELDLLFGTLNKKIIDIFKIWQEKNISKLEQDDFAIEYIQKVRKILGKTENQDIENNKLRNKLYKYLKVNIKTLIEYDFN